MRVGKGIGRPHLERSQIIDQSLWRAWWQARDCMQSGTSGWIWGTARDEICRKVWWKARQRPGEFK